MSKKEQATTETRSKSQIKREARQKEVLDAKKAAKKHKVINGIALTVIAALLVVAVGFTVYNKMNTTTANGDYSAMLTDEGLMKNVDVASCISTIDYNNIEIPLADIAFTDEMVDADIQEKLDAYPVLNTEPSRIAADGDTLNLDYVGTIDGVEFEGGSTNGAGTSLTLGSGTFVDDFEAQLVGSSAGTEKTVSVTFPEDYTSADLAGKDAEFAVTVNGVYDDAIFDDAFVILNLSDYADSAEGYRTYLKETNYATNLTTYLTDLITSGSSASSYTDDYIKYAKSLKKYNDYAAYESMNEMYNSYLGYSMYNKFSDYTGLSDSDYEASLADTAKTKFATDGAYQQIFTDAGLSISEEDYTAFAASMGADAETIYGKGYIMQLLMQNTVINHLSEIATVS